MSELTIFDKIVARDIPARIVWEDASYMAFLTPFPNTPGSTVVIPKTRLGDYIFDLTEEQAAGLMQACATVAKLLEKAFQTTRVGMVFDGTGVPYVHARLSPMIRYEAGKSETWSQRVEFNPVYQGYVTSADGPRMSEQELDEIFQQIRSVQ